MRFLIVDDSVTIRRTVTKYLDKIDNVEIIEAEDGKDALAKMYTENIDFVITDWNMPEMNGLDFVKMMREEPNFSEIPVLMLTIQGLKTDIIAALKAGVNSYVIKPFTAKVLLAKINELRENNSVTP